VKIGVVVKYISPDAVEDMPDLVGMRVTSIQGTDVKRLSLEEVPHPLLFRDLLYADTCSLFLLKMIAALRNAHRPLLVGFEPTVRSKIRRVKKKAPASPATPSPQPSKVEAAPESPGPLAATMLWSKCGLQSEPADSSKWVEMLGDEFVKLEKARAKLELELQMSKKEVEDLKRDRSPLEQALRVSQASCSELESILTEVAQEKDETAGERQKQNSNLQTQLAASEFENEKLNHTIDKLRQERQRILVGASFLQQVDDKLESLTVCSPPRENVLEESKRGTEEEAMSADELLSSNHGAVAEAKAAMKAWQHERPCRPPSWFCIATFLCASAMLI